MISIESLNKQYHSSANVIEVQFSQFQFLDNKEGPSKWLTPLSRSFYIIEIVQTKLMLLCGGDITPVITSFLSIVDHLGSTCKVGVMCVRTRGFV